MEGRRGAVGTTSTALRLALLVSSSRKEKRKGERATWPRLEDKDASAQRARIAGGRRVELPAVGRGMGVDTATVEHSNMFDYF